MSIYGLPTPRAPKPLLSAPIPVVAQMPDNIAESSSEEELTIQEIIREKPRTRVVREFLRAQLIAIKSPEEELFDK